MRPSSLDSQSDILFVILASSDCSRGSNSGGTACDDDASAVVGKLVATADASMQLPKKITSHSTHSSLALSRSDSMRKHSLAGRALGLSWKRQSEASAHRTSCKHDTVISGQDSVDPCKKVVKHQTQSTHPIGAHISVINIKLHYSGTR
jgi:hypothetical protein